MPSAAPFETIWNRCRQCDVELVGCTRFLRTNPDAPRACESCGENRVLDVAHKPGHERIGRGRRSDLMRWPEQVWVLCPTCHALHDRMHYSPEDLGLKV